MAWYPKRSHYYAACSEHDEIEQGDIFWGVPTLVARHPDLADAFQQPLRDLPQAEDLECPPISRVLSGVGLHRDPVIVMPHTCDFYGPEKGRANRARLVARIQRIVGSGVGEPAILRSGNGYNHTFFLPSWESPNRDLDDMFVNFRFMTTVDAAYLSRKSRLARLSQPALVAFRRRVAHFFTDYAPMPSELSAADLQGGLVRQDRDLVPTSRVRSVLGSTGGPVLRSLFDPSAGARESGRSNGD
ncbi:MAG: hypothetical protein HY332_00160 [Chloroflexi bacterium]|nr:hypothetical protein [Chloroflexota bacterium]